MKLKKLIRIDFNKTIPNNLEILRKYIDSYRPNVIIFIDS